MTTLRKIPGLSSIARVARFVRARVTPRTAANVFTDIYRNNKWNGPASVSGTGSDLHQTRVIARELPKLLRELEIRSILDIPCGDFHWMRHVELGPVQYIGADIVKGLVRDNQRRYGSSGVRFQHGDLLEGRIPRAELVFCRDCLVHFPFEGVFTALRNICDSGATYLLTTTFPGRDSNRDIQIGEWRPLNLQAEPISLPEPVRLINEECTENAGIYADKSLGLWKIEVLRERLAKMGR